MKDLRTILMTPLFAALTAVTGRKVFTKMSQGSEYPYIFISDFYQKESGPKGYFMYDVELLIFIKRS